MVAASAGFAEAVGAWAAVAGPSSTLAPGSIALRGGLDDARTSSAVDALLLDQGNARKPIRAADATVAIPRTAAAMAKAHRACRRGRCICTLAQMRAYVADERAGG